MPSTPHEQLRGKVESILERKHFTVIARSPIKGFIPDVIAQKFRGDRIAEQIIVEVEVISNLLWGDHTLHQMQKMRDYLRVNHGFPVKGFLVVPPGLRDEAKALLAGWGYVSIEVWTP